MLVRSSLKRLATTICYPMSQKKLTEQWRKPIEQLKQQKQQSTPIPPDADQKKKAAMEFYEKEYFSKHKIRPEDAAAASVPAREKKMFKKKAQQKEQAENVEGTQQTLKQTKPKAPEINWLEMSQIKETKELTELVNQALNMSKLKYYPELKDVLSKIKVKFGGEEFDFVLTTLLKQNFLQTYESLGQLDLELKKLSPKIITTILFNFLQLEDYTKVQTLLKELRTDRIQFDLRRDDFFELLFYKETSQDIAFQYGQNSVNISSDNSNFVKKLQIVNLYLTLIEELKRKRGSKSLVLPLWLNQAYKIVVKYRFGREQFRRVLTKIMTQHDYLLPDNILQTPQFAQFASQFYFGHQQSLKMLVDFIERHFHRNIKFSVFHKNFTDQLMNWRTEHGQPAFEVDQELIEAYKRGFQQNRKNVSIVASIIAADARYVDLAQHYVKSYMQGFPNESLTSEETKFVEQSIVDNYNSVLHSEKHEKLLTRLTKPGQNTLNKLKASIKLGNLTQAYKVFEEEIYKKVVIERQRKNIEFVLRSLLSQKSSSFAKIKDIDTFLESLNDEYLWSLYQRSEDISVMLKKYIPEDKFSFWEEQQKKERFEEISKKYATGYLETVKQPQSDIEVTGFNLEEYMANEFPQLRELQMQEYEKQKDLIKFTLRVEGLIFYHRIHSDDLVIEKLQEFYDELSEETLQVLEQFGLKDYNIKEWGWEHFEKRFNTMKTQNNVLKDERLDWSGYIKFIQRNKALNKKNIIEEMMIKTPELFKEAQALVRLGEEPIVNKLLIWGVYTNEPMAVYLAEKLAMQTGQVIPHQIALKVGKMLSYRRPLSEEFIQKCKDCLKVVGKIDREFIYLFDKDYEHILQRRNFVKYVTDKIEEKKQDHRELEDLITFTPRQYLYRPETKLYEQSITNRAHLL